MTQFEIFNRTSGESVGIFDGDNADAALDAMVAHELNGRDGWKSYVLDEYAADADCIHQRIAALNAWRDDYRVIAL